MQDAIAGDTGMIELETIEPILDVQKDWSILPNENQFLIEKSYFREGCHVFFFPFEGRYVHEGMSALIAHRISKMKPISFSIAMNDYGFELLSDQDIPIEEALENNVLSPENLMDDISASMNDSELAKRKFWEIGQVAGLVFHGFPGEQRKTKHLRMSTSLMFDVFTEYEPGHLLIQQAFDEVMFFQLDEIRLTKVLMKIQDQEIVVNHTERFTPYAFPIFVDRLRGKLSSEKLIDRVRKMQLQLKKHVK
jgi:ATP-dependent Lhr-like helicase